MKQKGIERKYTGVELEREHYPRSDMIGYQEKTNLFESCIKRKDFGLYKVVGCHIC